MNVFRNVVFVAALAGLVAGLLLATLQTFATVPLILEAESYEEGFVPPAHSRDQAAAPHSHDEGAPAHRHDEDAWEPANGAERFLYTVLANVVSGIGFALILVAVSEAAGGINGWRQGLFWGFAGFGVFTLAPGLGLPPELPAMATADLTARQIWWLATVAATAGGLWLIAFRRSALLALGGVALIVAPHLVGAPQPAEHASPIPEELHHRFVVAVTVTNLVFWLALGGVTGLLRRRFAGEAEKLRDRFA